MHRASFARLLPRLFLAACVGGVIAAGCLPTRPVGDVEKIPEQEDPGMDAGLIFPDASSMDQPDAPGADPHGLSTLTPNHGPFAGGTRVVIQGGGFAFQPRVWFGDIEATEVVAASAKKLQVTSPPNKPGTVDVSVQDGDDASTKRVLMSAFSYDDFYVDPAQGPISGGTHITLHGSGTHWTAAGATTLAVNIGNQLCGTIAVTNDTTISCIAPASTAGARPVAVVGADGSVDSVLDAYTYADSDNGFRGGLSGDPLAGMIRVLAFDSYSGNPLPGSVAILGSSLQAAMTKTLDDNGEAIFQDASLTTPVTVTVAHKCSAPTTFVGVPVDTVTMYLDPLNTPDCATMNMNGDIPPTGGLPGDPSTLTGDLVFPLDSEFKQMGWSNVPMAVNANEHRAAYLFLASSDPRAVFQLPDPTTAVTEMNADGYGYAFTMKGMPAGNITVYAIAGIEDRTMNPPLFTGYAMGVAAGVMTLPGSTTADVTISMNVTLDQAVTLDLEPPPPGADGPDRVVSAVSLSLGSAGFAIFPAAQRTSLLPFSGSLIYSGLPPLSGVLAGAAFVASAEAGDGPSLTLPKSVIGDYATSDTSQTITLDQFVRVPSITTPASGATWDGSSYAISLAPTGVEPDLFVLDVESAGGLVGWTIASPGNTPSFQVPDLRSMLDAGLLPGAITIDVVAAQITDFDYHLLRYRHLDTRGWDAYSEDLFHATLAP